MASAMRRDRHCRVRVGDVGEIEKKRKKKKVETCRLGPLDSERRSIMFCRSQF